MFLIYDVNAAVFLLAIWIMQSLGEKAVKFVILSLLYCKDWLFQGMSTEIFIHTFDFSRVLQVFVESVFYSVTKALMKFNYSEQLLAVFSDVKY